MEVSVQEAISVTNITHSGHGQSQCFTMVAMRGRLAGRFHKPPTALNEERRGGGPVPNLRNSHKKFWGTGVLAPMLLPYVYRTKL
jgi:hypothetical protein